MKRCLPAEPLPQLEEVLQRRALGEHVAFDQDLLDLVPHRRELLAAQSCLLRGPLPLLVEGQKGRLVPGELPDIGGGEGGGEGAGLEALSPRRPGGGATLRRVAEILLGGFEPIGEEVE